MLGFNAAIATSPAPSITPPYRSHHYHHQAVCKQVQGAGWYSTCCSDCGIPAADVKAPPSLRQVFDNDLDAWLLLPETAAASGAAESGDAGGTLTLSAHLAVCLSVCLTGWQAGGRF